MRNAMLVVLLALPVAWFAFAQPDKSQPPAKDALNVEQMGKLLKDMGYDPQALSDDVWQVSVNREGWKVHVMVSLGPDADRVWLECKFAPVPDPELVPSSAWLRLLEENERIGPAHFAFDKADKRVHLFKSFDNVGVSPARLKKEIEGFDAVVRRTQNVWRAENFAPAESLPVAPRTVEEEPKKQSLLEGKWRIVRIEREGKQITDEQLQALKPSVVFRDDKAVINPGMGGEQRVQFKLDPTSKPASIDLIDEEDKRTQGIYVLETGLLTICLAAPGEDRPRQFVPDIKQRGWLMVLKRAE